MTPQWSVNCQLVNIKAHPRSLSVDASTAILIPKSTITLQILIRTAKFLQVFVATANSLCQLFHCSTVNLLNDIRREYNVHTADQLASRVNDVFTAAA